MHQVRSTVHTALALAVLGTVISGTSHGVADQRDGADPGGTAMTVVAHAWATETMRRMSLEQKVSQLFVTYVWGPDANTPDPRNRVDFGVDTPAEAVRRYNLGGVIYFNAKDNVRDPRQVAALSNGLQRAALSSGPRVPLLVSVDQEQGIVARLGPPATQFPGAMALGAGRSPEDAKKAAEITGHELHAVGIQQNFAPVADVNVNPANPVIGVRSVSSDPRLVSDIVSAQIKGYQRTGASTETVSATAKHFPGHGDTNQDSHLTLPVINHDRQQWEHLDAPPFRAAIASGADAIMSAHIVMPKLDDSGEPATLAPKILTGMLRQELGYRGVIITDALEMEAVRVKHPDARIPVLALRAGADLLLIPKRLDVAINGVLEAVRSGELSERRIEQSLYRVLLLKFKRGVLVRPFVDEAAVSNRVGTAKHLAEAQRITNRTTTLLRNDSGLLPLRNKPAKVLVTGWGVSTTRTLAERITARGPAATAHPTGLEPTETVIQAAVDAAGNADLVVALTNNASKDAGQLELVRRLHATGKPVIAVAVRNPYDAAAVEQVTTWLATYSYTAVAIESLARVLFGEISPMGKLPVSIPSVTDPTTTRFPFGHGLTW